jgi:rsbT co-antagonist protein RsbR
MAIKELQSISKLLAEKENKILEAWVKAQTGIGAFKEGLITEKKLREESSQFIGSLVKAMDNGNLEDITAREYEKVIKFLADLSLSRASEGFSPSDTAIYIFSLKDVVLQFLQTEYESQPKILNKMVVAFSSLADKLGLVSFETYTKGREKVIVEQRSSLLELSTPVIQVWDGVLVLPLVGTIDSNRAKQIMEGVLNSIVATKSTIVIIDITGVSVVDTEVANSLTKTMGAARLLGSECILTGISPYISQTLVHLGIDLSGFATRASLRDGLEIAFKKLKLKVIKVEG